MTRRLVLIALAWTLALSAPEADERRLGAEDIVSILTGNTARGAEPGPAYLQYFDASGLTTYTTRSGPPDHGRWRVDEAGLYCSQWRDGGWSCYEVWGEDDRVTWISPSGTRYPAVMLEGRVNTF